MRWSDERWIKVYTRDTGDWLALGWEAQALFLLALRKADRAGLVQTGKMRLRGLSGMTGMPLGVVTRAVALLLEDGCLRESDGGYIIPNFIAAQEALTSDAQRKRDQRERDRDKEIASGGPLSRMAADSLAASRRTVTEESHAPSHMESRPAVTHGGHTGTVTPRVDESRVEEITASQEPSPVPEQVELVSVQPTVKKPRKQREPSAAEAMFAKIQETRVARCVEVNEPVVPERWDFARQNKVIGDLLKQPESERRLFESAWELYLADDGERVREPAWSLSWFMQSGVRARYETRAAREEAA